jgi:hypothetical protein
MPPHHPKGESRATAAAAAPSVRTNGHSARPLSHLTTSRAVLEPLTRPFRRDRWRGPLVLAIAGVVVALSIATVVALLDRHGSAASAAPPPSEAAPAPQSAAQP